MSKFRYCSNCQATHPQNGGKCSSCGTARRSGHGGSRPAVRLDDGRLARKLKNPVRITVILEQHQLDWLGTQGDRQGVLRGLVEEAMLITSTPP